MKPWYQPSAKVVAEVELPALNYLMIDGVGDPNTAPEYAAAVEVLFTVSYALKFMVKRSAVAVDYGVMPLEGLWWVEDGIFDITIKDNWFYTLMIMQPEVITKELFEEALEQVRKKKGESEMFSKLKLTHFEEGLCVQTMHIGPYATEPATIERMKEFMKENGLRDNVGPNGKHHEIYLSDPRKAAADKMKTVLRHPVIKL